LLDANTRVLNLRQEDTIMELNIDDDMALVRELDSVAHEVKEHLLVPLLIRHDFLRDIICNINFQVQLLLLELKLHNVTYFSDSSS